MNACFDKSNNFAVSDILNFFLNLMFLNSQLNDLRCNATASDATHWHFIKHVSSYYCE